MIVDGNLSRAFRFVTVILGVGFAAPGAMAAKVQICHKETKTLSVNERSLPAHKAHGDFMGKCGEVRTETLLLSCALDGPNHIVSAVSTSAAITQELVVPVIASNCAEALHVVEVAGCEVRDTFGTPEAQTYSFDCPSEGAVIPVPAS